MHCPRCGQQQISEEIKYCSRCGLPLAIVAEVLAHGGFLPRLSDLQKDKKWLTRNNGLKIALLWFVVFICLVPLAGVTKAPGDITGGLAILGFVGGLLLTVLSFLFLPSLPKTSKNQGDFQNINFASPQTLTGNAATAATALPPQTSQPVSDYAAPGAWKAPDTGELAPHSVTDNTTKLLQKSE